MKNLIILIILSCVLSCGPRLPHAANVSNSADHSENPISSATTLPSLPPHRIDQPYSPPKLDGTAPLYPFPKNGLWGYIDGKGRVKIPAQFHSAGQFSEGLAEVRQGGYYGYLNLKGEMVITPQYDMAYPFDQGVALVYVGHKPYFINPHGEILFEHNCEQIQPFGSRTYTIAITGTQMHGLINRKGEWLTDTIYKSLQVNYTYGVAIGTTLPYAESDRGRQGKSLIDSTGKVLVAPGIYAQIYPFKGSLTSVSIIPEDPEEEYEMGYLDTKGKLYTLTEEPEWELGLYDHGFSEGLAVVTFEKENSEGLGYDEARYKGVIDQNFNLVFMDTNYQEITPYHQGRAFAMDRKTDWHLLDREGKVLNEEQYHNLLFDLHSDPIEKLFANGMAFVEIDSGWVGIDRNGKHLTGWKEFWADRYYRKGNTLFFMDEEYEEGGEYGFQFGWWNPESEVFVESQFQQVLMDPITEDPILVVEKDRMGYVTPAGKYIWRQSKERKNALLKPLNIDFMNRGYIYASAPRVDELAGVGGWGGQGRSINDPQKIPLLNNFESNALNIVLDPEAPEVFGEKYKGIKLYIANTTGDTVYFSAQDSRLYVNLQAMDLDGKWKSIEYLPGSWCGNSYHTLYLPARHQWEFAVPVYEGVIKTRIRARVEYDTGPGYDDEQVVIYSNEIEGTVNPGQFWRKQRYYPAGLMDPYFD